MKAESLKRKIEEITQKIEELERQVVEVTRMRASVRKSKTLAAKAALEQNSRRPKTAVSPSSKLLSDPTKTRQGRARRMQELNRICGNILRQIMQHKWGWPFLKPVDAVALNLHDYHDIIRHPMDLGTVKDKIELRDRSGYKHPMEICEDVRLTFRNALTYNQPGTDVYVMAETLLKKWEEKWQQSMVPKLAEEETRRQQEEEDDKQREAMAVHAAEEAAAEKLAQDVTKQLNELDKLLHELNEKATSRCRPMSVEEKRQLGYDLGLLPPENLNRVIQIIAEKQPKFNTNADEVEVDIDAQDPATLWRLHRYVQSVLNPKALGIAGTAGLKGPQANQNKGHLNKKVKGSATT